ncbi:TerB N-terminal domain-containing protein [Massilia rubra]|uniref:tellurite resistance TerB family protein n=1 Tax=Massilia rubra TaxID=2607910 RepID=UPI00141EBB1A
MGASSSGDTEGLRTFVIGTPDSSSGYAIPPAPGERDTATWLAYAQSITISGVRINKGFIYFGPTLLAFSGRPDPSLIDPRKIVAPQGDYAQPLPEEWPSYSDTTPAARRAYLNWLGDGRSAPDADIGYVFLYFYGLERRIILDILRDGIGRSDFPHLYKELKRLYALYSDKSPTFRRHCAQLIELVEVELSEGKLYTHDVVVFYAAWGFPFLIRLALGQAVQDGLPVPAHLALAWAEHDPGIVRRTAFTRCLAEFRQLFMLTYVAIHGAGMMITPNRTRLKLSYQPASAGFDGCGGVDMDVGDIPDISALTAPVRALQEVVDDCVLQLDALSRYLGRNPDGRGKFDAICTLPVALWPTPIRNSLALAPMMVRDGPRLMSFGELLALFDLIEVPGKDQQQVLFGALELERVSIEPAISATTRAFVSTDPLVLFASGDVPGEMPVDGPYEVARLSVELAAAIAHADGDFSEHEFAHLNDSIGRWEHLASAARARLAAYACLLRANPVALSSMKKKVEMLDTQSRSSIAAFAATMVLADGVASTDEMRLLEKVYQQLGLERRDLYSDIHAADLGGAVPAQGMHEGAAANPGTFALDAAKIAALQASSRQLAERLASIFEDDPEPAPAPATPPPVASPGPQQSTSIMGLDQAHSTFARILTSRASWQRAELVDLAGALAIMLDGALERLNEASLDELDIMFSEGDDPIDINPEIVEKLTQ